MKATHKHTKILVGHQPVELNPGQFVFGRNVAAEQLASTPQKIRTCVKTLKKLEFLTIKSTNKYSIITVINWDSYQSDEEKITSNLTSKQPTNNQQITTYKNNKNIVAQFKPTNISTEKEKFSAEKNKYPFKFKRKVSLPKNFHTTTDMIEYAKELRYLGNPDEHTKTMILSASANGYKYKDWHSAWKTWLRNEIKKNPDLQEKEKVWADV